MATRVTITKALEARLRKGEGLEDVVKLLDAEQGKRAAAQRAETGEKTGLGYRELVALFRSYLGVQLLTPPKPSAQFIIKMVNKAREQGIGNENVEQILRGAKRHLAPPYRLADLVYNADRYYADAGIQGRGAEEGGERGGKVFTGRPKFGGDDDI